MGEPVSAVLLNWKRPWNIPVIAQELSKYEFVREIIIWNNGGALDAKSIGTEKAVVIDSTENMGTYGRYLGAKRALTSILYTQDDDVLVHSVGDMYDRFIKNNDDRITAGLAERHFLMEAHRKPWLLTGWGAFFRTAWMECIQEWIAAYGEGDLLYSKFDRIWTVLHGHHDPVVAHFTPLRNPNGEESGRDRNSLWLQVDHRQKVENAVSMAAKIAKTSRRA